MWFVEAYMAEGGAREGVNCLVLLVVFNWHFATFPVGLICHLDIVYKALLVLVTS